MIRRFFAAFSRYRPRVLTLVVLAAIAAVLVLANLSEEYCPRTNELAGLLNPPAASDLQFDLGKRAEAETGGSATWNMSYGWPLLWRQYVLVSGAGSRKPPAVAGANQSARRLAANLAIWLVLLAVPAAVCEWLVRRYRLRFRFSLRSMLAATCLAAAFCAWFVSARKRANVQDPIIDSDNVRFTSLWVERWGPKWLDLLGADRYRRRIVGAALAARDIEGLLGDLKRLPELEYLSLEGNQLSAGMIDALGELRQVRELKIDVGKLTDDSGRSLARVLGGMEHLRALSIRAETYYPGHLREQAPANEKTSDERAAPAGVLNRLEHLYLTRRAIANEDLARLAGMPSLKSLTLWGIVGKRDAPAADRSLLANLPAETHFAKLDLAGSLVGDGDLPHIAALAQLKSLSLIDTDVTDVGLAQLAPLESLEELTLDSSVLLPAGSDALFRLKRLKRLHVESFNQDWLQSREVLGDGAPDGDFNAWLRGLAALRASRPGFTVDGEVDESYWHEESLAPQCEKIPDLSPAPWAAELVRAWKEEQAATAANPPAASPPPAK